MITRHAERAHGTRPAGAGSIVTPARTVADAVGTRLAALGVDTVFGVIGSGNLVVTNAICAGGAGFLAARHANGALCMADGWGRVTGRVGVCSVHQGPGLTNAVTGLAEAAKSRTPLLVLAGDTPAAALGSNFRIDQHELVRAVGAIPARIEGPETAEADAARALRLAELERRPVVLNLPIDLQAVPAAEARAVDVGAVPRPPAPARADIEEIVGRLRAARRPVIIAGRGAVVSGAREPLEALGDRCGALLATSAVAHGLFAGAPYDIGISGGFASPFAAELLPQADLVLAFGAGLNQWTTRHTALIGRDACVVQVDVDPGVVGTHNRVDLGVVGDAAAVATAVVAALGDDDLGAGFRTGDLGRQIAARRWPAEPYEDRGAERVIDPRTLSLAIRDLLPADSTVVVDSGHFTGWPSMFFDVPDARSWVFVNAFQAVGLGLGCAIGAAVARPDRITVAALGDGGLFLALQELDTAVRAGVRLLVLVYDDAADGAEVHHSALMGHDTATTRCADADLAAIARATGAAAVTVQAPTDLDEVRAWVADGRGPLVVDAKVDPDVRADWLEEAFRAG
jgi:thiamine pyrophosphate-dependent acetolactate synthase large subunit-like protein